MSLGNANATGEDREFWGSIARGYKSAFIRNVGSVIFGAADLAAIGYRLNEGPAPVALALAAVIVGNIILVDGAFQVGPSYRGYMNARTFELDLEKQSIAKLVENTRTEDTYNHPEVIDET